jgi:lipoate-protein ligase B
MKRGMSALLYKDLGQIDYWAALELQQKLVETKQRQLLPDILLVLEHPHVYTLGRGGNASNVLSLQDVPLYRTNRGGDVTYHGPGQMVVYPIVDLRSKLRRAVHHYLRNLELSAIHTLNDFGLQGIRRPPYTGIWIDDKKIAAIGIAVRRAVAFHGLALNVNTDLSYFNRIIPCGLPWADVTSMAGELGTEQNIVDIKKKFLDHFADTLGYSDIAEIENLLDFQAGPKGSSEVVPSSSFMISR